MYRRDSFLPFSPPLISQAEIDSVIDTLRSGWITTGPKTHRFETAFADYMGAPAALALSSCTAGLHISLLALGIGPGDEVITTPMTFAASVNVIEHVGARPVLVDIEPDTLTIDPSLIEPALTPSTRAILAVHYAGHPADLDPIRTIQKSRHLSLIEDAAHSLPAEYKGERIGCGDNPVSFSFYATKNLTTGEGGMLTGSSVFLEKARIISLHGMSKDAWRRYDRTGSWYYEVILPGFKYNMTDIQAAIGLEQLKRIDTFQNRRRKIVERYNYAFAGNDAIELPTARPDVSHAWHLYVIRLHLDALQIDRNRFIEEMTNRNIGTSVHFIPIHLHPYYRDRYHYSPTDFPVAYAQYQRIVSLPLNPSMSDRDADDVIEAVLDVLRTYHR
jgi:dTDP-4-amino-4,6-dideoxygalactose transaminase